MRISNGGTKRAKGVIVTVANFDVIVQAYVLSEVETSFEVEITGSGKASANPKSIGRLITQV